MGAEIVNDITGEALLTAEDGRSWGLLFDLRAIKEIETTHRMSITDLTDSWGTKRPGVEDLERLVVIGSKGYCRSSGGDDKPLMAANVLDAIGAAGKFTTVFKLVVKALMLSWSGTDPDEEGEASDAGPPGRGATP